MKLWIIIIFSCFVIISCACNIKNRENNDLIFNEKVLTEKNNSKISPSGEYELLLDIGYNKKSPFYYFIIKKNDNVIYTCDEKFYNRHTFFLCWDDISDIVWCYSGDIGTFYWVNENNVWKKYSYFNENVYNLIPPNILNKLRPNYF
jgi:hypothetical protein